MEEKINKEVVYIRGGKPDQREEEWMELEKEYSCIDQGPVPERRNISIQGINVPYFRDNFIPGINSVP